MITTKEAGTIYTAVQRKFLEQYVDKSKPWITYGAGDEGDWEEMTEQCREFHRRLIAAGFELGKILGSSRVATRSKHTNRI